MTEPAGDPLRATPFGPTMFSADIRGVAARALVAEFARLPGPKTALVVGGTAGSAVLIAAVDALTPDDSLTVVAGVATEEVRARVAALGPWVQQRVRVVEALVDAEAADAVILAELVAGTADAVKARLDELAKLLNPGGVLAAATPAAPFLAGEAGTELDRQSVLFGVGADLVLRNVPPVRVHRLRYTPAEVALAERLAPLGRTSSVTLTPDMHIDSNGVAAAAICLGTAALLRRAGSRRLWLAPLLAAGPVTAFFRDPERVVPEDPGAVVAASDGTVLGVERLRDERLGDGEFLRVAVFLSVLDVHVNRAPAAGRVVDYFVADGGYAPAMKSAAEHNVAAYTLLDTARGRVAVAQRTGLIARRIVHRAPVGSLLARGERFGLIRFGSRTDVYLPADAATAAVAPGEKVRGGETTIARWV